MLWFCLSFYYPLPARTPWSRLLIWSKYTKSEESTHWSQFSSSKFYINTRNFDLIARNLKGGIGSLFDPFVNAMGRRPYCSSRMEGSYCTFGFGTIIRCDLRTLSLLRDSPWDIQYVCAIWVHAGKATHAITKLFGGLSYKKIRRYNNSPPYVVARWLPQ